MLGISKADLWIDDPTLSSSGGVNMTEIDPGGPEKESQCCAPSHIPHQIMELQRGGTIFKKEN